MVPQSNGKMFLTEERGVTEYDSYRTYSTFNFGKFYNSNKPPFGALAVLNEDTIAPGKSMYMPVTVCADVILIPAVGDIEYADSLGNTSVVQVGQAQLFSVPAGASYTVTNPYSSALINFLQLWLIQPAPLCNGTPQLFAFDIEASPNCLLPVFHKIQHINAQTSAQYVLSIGRFSGRSEAAYTMNNPGNGLFFFVIEGAFEIQNRLLHNGDGLALWGVEEAELEALSNNAVVVVLETPL